MKRVFIKNFFAVLSIIMVAIILFMTVGCAPRYSKEEIEEIYAQFTNDRIWGEYEEPSIWESFINQNNRIEITIYSKCKDKEEIIKEITDRYGDVFAINESEDLPWFGVEEQ